MNGDRTENSEGRPFSASEGLGMILTAAPWGRIIPWLFAAWMGVQEVQDRGQFQKVQRENEATRSIVYQNEVEAIDRWDAKDQLIELLLAKVRELEGEKFGPRRPEGDDHGNEPDGH